MVKRKRSHRQKHRNNRNHFPFSRRVSTDQEFHVEFDGPRDSNETAVFMNEACLETPKVIDFSDWADVSQLQTEVSKYRSHSCVSRLHFGSDTLRQPVTPKSLHELTLSLNEVNLDQSCSNESFVSLEAVFDVPDICITCSTPKNQNIDTETQTDLSKSAPRRLRSPLTPTYEVHIENCNLTLQNAYCDGANNFTPVFTTLRRCAYYTLMKFFEMCWWLGIALRFCAITLYMAYKERSAPTFQNDVQVLSECIKTLVNDVAVLKTELCEFRREFREIRATSTQVVCVQAPPPPPPPPPPPLPPPPITITQVISKKTPKKKPSEERPIISLEDILNVKLRKTTERPSSISVRDEIHTTPLKHLKLRSASARMPVTTTNETFSTESSLSNSPQSSLTRLLLDVNCSKVRRVKRLRKHILYTPEYFSRNSPESRDRLRSCTQVP